MPDYRRCGALSCPDGRRYEGPLQDGQAQGQGAMLGTDSARYEGEFAGGRPNCQGRLSLPSGDSYEGIFAQGQPSGAGVAVSAQGWRFDGEFLAGIPTERGRYSAADGSEIRQPVAQSVREALSLKLPSTAFLSRPLAAAMVCTRMPKPDAPYTGSWKGEAEYRFVVTVQDGKVSNVRAVAVKHPGKKSVDEVLLASFTKTFDGYHCPGNHVFVQEFKIRVD